MAANPVAEVVAGIEGAREACGYAFRAQKQLGIALGAPVYKPLDSWQAPEGPARHFSYSPTGHIFAYSSAGGVFIHDAHLAGPALVTIPNTGVHILGFSPRGSYLLTWERYSKNEDGSQPKNVKVWDTKTGEEVYGFGQRGNEGWELQFADDESKAVRLCPNELQVYDPSDFAKGLIEKVRIEGVKDFSVSPGPNPSVAALVAEKNGAPATMKIHQLSTLSITSTQKTFFKADKVQMKWSSSGTTLLFLTQTDVDKTGKSYYGQTNLYSLSTTGIFDNKVTLDREGPIHDFAWSPNAKEFAVCYGFMPAKTTLFDVRCRPVHEFGLGSRNFISFSPSGRLMVLAGFGNLAGQVDIFDRRTLTKRASFNAPNSSSCDWSPDGRFLLCATLSPRLRVDNGVRIYHNEGTLCHVQLVEELYQAAWQPQSGETGSEQTELSPCPAPSDSIVNAPATKPAFEAKGAYRPPGARGTMTPSAFMREDQGGAPYSPSPAASPALGGPGVGSLSNLQALQGQRRRVIPGAAPPKEIPGAAPKNEKKPKNKDKGGGATNGSGGPSTPVRANGAGDARPGPGARTNSVDKRSKARGEKEGVPAEMEVASPVVSEPPTTPASRALNPANEPSNTDLTPEDRKKRALQKKLTAIQGLKERRDGGEKLEKTQLQKIETEASIQAELRALG